MKVVLPSLLSSPGPLVSEKVTKNEKCIYFSACQKVTVLIWYNYRTILLFACGLDAFEVFPQFCLTENILTFLYSAHESVAFLVSFSFMVYFKISLFCKHQTSKHQGNAFAYVYLLILLSVQMHAMHHGSQPTWLVACLEIYNKNVFSSLLCSEFKLVLFSLYLSAINIVFTLRVKQIYSFTNYDF